MSDTTTTTQAAADVAKEIGRFAVKTTAQTAVEMTAAVVVLAAAGAVYNKVVARRNKKSLAIVSE